jgi:site-specific recombinase XerD
VPRNGAQDCPYFFWNGETSRRAVVGIAERTLSAVFKKSGVKDAHAHRYRHTLATRLLEQGATFEQVADILGNSPAVVRKHYGKWSPGRQNNIDRLMMAHFDTMLDTNSSHTAVTPKFWSRKLMKLQRLKWCGEGDLNPHELAPASTSS